MLSRFVIVFLPRSKRLLILCLQSSSALILKPKKIKSVTVSLFLHLFAMTWWDWMPWSSFFECWVLSQLSLSSFTIIKRLFSSSSLCAIKVVSSPYMRLLIFLPAVLIPACESYSPAFHIMYSEYKLSKHSDNTQPWHTHFPTLNQSIVPCLVLLVAFCPACRLLRM